MKKFGRYYFIITQTISLMIMPELITWFICYKTNANNILMYSLIATTTIIGVISGILFSLKAFGIIGRKNIINEDTNKNLDNEQKYDEKNEDNK